ncbi:hypothetical protein RDV84_01705 [Lysobacter yananisis]|uniref:Uncharacterized protein n=2 Tax=Lysobacter TaxID=68 RepID=A0A0S2DCU0_LYSEN|nr:MULTISPECIES: hypothetical protein [Lysobacter]ALN56342.1 hypothetical protein GLE_0984 [Lysobacter enzymogenes]QCW25197.1 hypothetical protein FE772_05525 [Lysobacter enzymogenes]WMT03591.1 hypothetical protein RDV84_01705 [Lysobacter yananisis]
MKLRISGQEQEQGQEPQQAQAAPEQAGPSYDVRALNEHLGDRHARQQQPAGPEQGPALDWQRNGPGQWAEPGAQAPQPAQADLTPEQRMQRYREVVQGAMDAYRGEVATERENAASRRAAHPEGPQVNAERAREQEKHWSGIESAASQLNALVKNPIPAAAEARFRPLIDDRVDNMVQLAATPQRPDVERIRNQDDVRGRQPHQELGKDGDGRYHLTDPSTGQRAAANGDFVFVIPVSNPSQVWIGERATGGHTAISRGGDVYYAGEVSFRDGEITRWSNDSGHYRPNADLHRQVGSASIATLEGLLPRDKFQPYNG